MARLIYPKIKVTISVEATYNDGIGYSYSKTTKSEIYGGTTERQLRDDVSTIVEAAAHDFVKTAPTTDAH